MNNGRLVSGLVVNLINSFRDAKLTYIFSRYFNINVSNFWVIAALTVFFIPMIHYVAGPSYKKGFIFLKFKTNFQSEDVLRGLQPTVSVNILKFEPS